MTEMPKDPENSVLLCPKCGTGNPPEVTQCSICGAEITQAIAPRPMPLAPRVLFSLAVGLPVLWIVTSLSLDGYRHATAYHLQGRTLAYIRKVEARIEEYRKEHHALPVALSELPQKLEPMDSAGTPADVWQRPLHYQAVGNRYRIVSYGRDGKPGGIGLDTDLSSDDLSSISVNRWPTAPRQARATFPQFLTDRGEYANSGSGIAMALLSLLSGVAAFTLAFRVLSRPGRSGLSLMLQLLVTLGATLVVGFIITTLHAPSGH